MQVFISWSGETSRKAAEQIHVWLPSVIQRVSPYFSPDDVAKGSRWFPEIASELEASGVGILCLTPDNLESPWVLFEAGALSKNIDESRICPLLLGLEPTDIQGPLAQFQAASFAKEEMWRVVAMINSQLEEHALDKSVLESVYEKWWPDLKREIDRVLTERPEPETPRSTGDMLKEILSLVREANSFSRHDAVRDEFRNFKTAADLVVRFDDLVHQVTVHGAPEPVLSALELFARPLYVYYRHPSLNPKHRQRLQMANAELSAYLMSERSRDEKAAEG